MRVIAPTLLVLILIGTIACSGSNNQWQPHRTLSGVLRRDLVGDPSKPGPYKYQLKITAGTRVTAHKHSVDVHVKVLSGSMFIIIGEPLVSSRAQHFVTGSEFVVPANTWHDEWWDHESILEAEGVGPMTTTNKFQEESAELILRIDHLVYATPDLNRGVEEIEKLIGIRATPGGQHPGRGSRNALIALGPTNYLEIIAPDPEQPAPKEPRPFGLDTLKESKLVAWCVNGGDLEGLKSEALLKGVRLGEVRSGSRRRPDGVQLSWKFTDPSVVVADGLVPFFINWGDSTHPAQTSARGASLVGIRAEHPDVQGVREMLLQLGLDLPVNAGKSPALIATIEGPRGRVELR